MKVSLATVFILVLFVTNFADVLAAPENSNALMTSSKRAQTWEFNFGARYLDSKHIGFTGGASADIDSTLGWGFGLGYNFNQNLGLNFNASWSSADYNATRVIDDGSGTTKKVNGTLDSNSLDIRLTYNFMNKRFSPFVTGGLGWVFVDSNIPTGETGDVCWWDPWYGYICSSYDRTYNETNFMYGASAGLRFDVSRNFFLRASVGSQWVNFDTSSGDVGTVYYQLDLGFMM